MLDLFRFFSHSEGINILIWVKFSECLHAKNICPTVIKWKTSDDCQLIYLNHKTITKYLVRRNETNVCIDFFSF